MIDPTNVPEVNADEPLARYVMQKSHVRADGTIKHNAFMPPADLKLSVTRHRDATDQEIWTVGHDVARQRRLILFGRADVAASACITQGLRTEAESIPGNSNHANIVGWPADKPAQKSVAQQIAANAMYKSVS